MRLITFVCFSLLAFQLIGCGGSGSASSSSEKILPKSEFENHVRLDAKFGGLVIFNGELEPEATIKVTNIGDVAIDRLKFFCEIDAGPQYSESLVVDRKVSIQPNTTSSIEVSWPKRKIKNPDDLMVSSALGSGANFKIELVQVEVR